VALEPTLAPTLFQARQAGQPVDVSVSGIAADSLGAKRIGEIAWNVSQRYVKDALLLSDEVIRDAQLWLWNELKLAVEPAAALGLAALQSGAYRPQAQERVCLILCGANLDPTSLAGYGHPGPQGCHPGPDSCHPGLQGCHPGPDPGSSATPRLDCGSSPQ
jgi:threonine dehydratase